MSYLTPAQLVDGPGRLQELAELFELDPPLLRATIDSGDRSGFDPDDVAAADAALASVHSEILRAAGEIDARLVMRGYGLPVNVAQCPVLVTYARALVRYQLHAQRDRTDEGHTFRIERDRREALQALDQIAAGKLGLGPNDPLAPPQQPAPSSGPTYVAPPRVFSRDRLADY